MQLWWRSRTPPGLLKAYQKLQAFTLPLILGAFRGSSARALELEAAMPPREVWFERTCSGFALRIHQDPGSHPVKAVASNLVRDEVGDSDTKNAHRPSSDSIIGYLQQNTQLL